jgi:MoaA/NifB/PqqE/SkfB family radical SAM enzyme
VPEQVVRVGSSSRSVTVEHQPVCHAPFSSLYLDPAGRVTACCANTWHPLGDLTRESLTDIWRGRAAERLRGRLAAGDLGLGCELCAAEVAVGSPATAELRRFDPLAPSVAEPEWPRQLELALSNACNLQCVMCNGELSSAIRIHREGRSPLPRVYGDEFFAELDEFLPHLQRVMFLGGEPFLGAEPMRVLDRLVERGLTPDVYVTSNGTQWNERVERALRSLPVDVSVSVDGFRKETIEAIRVGVRHEALVDNIGHYRAATRDNGGGFSLTFCLQRGNWRELGDVLAWGDRLDALVGVSTLTNPPHLSLHRLAGGELEEVVGVLHEQDGALRPRLGRNLVVWQRELGRLEALLAERLADASVSVSGGAGDGHAGAETLAASFADGRGVHRMHADGSQVVLRIEPDPSDVLGVDLADLSGAPTSALAGRLTEALGEVGDTSLRMHPGGVEERRIRFDRADGSTEVRAFLSSTGPETHVWVLAAREVPASVS